MASSAQVKRCRWKVNFSLTDKVLAKTIVDLPDVKLLKEVVENNTYVTAIEITTPELSFVEAVELSSLIANRCADLMSFIAGLSVSCTLQQINEIGLPGAVKASLKPFTVDAIISAPRDIDISTTPFLNVLGGKDEKLSRQLSHYRRGIASSDTIEKIREFYQVLEDEAGKPFRQRYGWLRDLVNHPELTYDTSSKKKSTEQLGKNYIDPSSPMDLKNLKEQLHQVKRDAEITLSRKLFLARDE